MQKMTNELNDEDFVKQCCFPLQTAYQYNKINIDVTIYERLLSLAKKGLKAEKLKEALEFYASGEAWYLLENTSSIITDKDLCKFNCAVRGTHLMGGKLSRAALKDFNDE